MIFNLLKILLPVFLFLINEEQSVEETQVKLALIEKFTKYIEWPSDYEKEDKFNIAVLGTSSLNTIAKKNLTGIYLKNKKTNLIDFTDRKSLQHIHLIVLGDISKEEFQEYKNLIKDMPVLTITDNIRLKNEGVHICFYLSDEGTVKFQINKRSMNKSQLRISYLLLRYADIVE